MRVLGASLAFLLAAAAAPAQTGDRPTFTVGTASADMRAGAGLTVTEEPRATWVSVGLETMVAAATSSQAETTVVTVAATVFGLVKAVFMVRLLCGVMFVSNMDAG